MSATNREYTEIEPPVVELYQSGNPGANVVVIGGMHGDEPSSVRFLEGILSGREDLTPERGSLTLVIANPTAYKMGVRAVNVNLNSILTTAEVVVGAQPEFKSASLLMDLLSKSDACIDLHEHKDSGQGSISMAPHSLAPLATALGVDTFIHGLEAIEPGASDSYMAEIGKPGFCIELGYYQEDNVVVAREVVHRFLSMMGILRVDMLPAPKPRIARAQGLIIRKTDQFDYAPYVKSGEVLPPGVFARDGGEEYSADGNGLSVLFPRPNNPVGASVGILVEFKEEPL